MASDFQVMDALGFSDYFEGRAFPELMGALVGLPMAVELYSDKIEEDHANHYLHDHEKDVAKLQQQQKTIQSQDNINLDDPYYFPGNLELDPFHLFPAEKKAERRVQFAEIMFGRVCMLAVATRLSEEVLWQLGFEDASVTSLASAIQNTLLDYQVAI